MSKKRDKTLDEPTASKSDAIEDGTSETSETSERSETPPSPEEVEEQKAEAELSHDIDHMEGEVAVLNDRHLRLVAEFTNYRRRAETELSEAWSRGQADMLRSFTDGLDDLQRVGAWQAESATVEALIEGVDLVERKFRQALEAAGVEMIDPLGEPFDPNIMEAMLGVPTEDPEQDQKVQGVFQKGYSFKGHLVRPARVTVFKHE
jgi:molecular chaperone GrpE